MSRGSWAGGKPGGTETQVRYNNWVGYIGQNARAGGGGGCTILETRESTHESSLPPLPTKKTTYKGGSSVRLLYKAIAAGYARTHVKTLARPGAGDKRGWYPFPRPHWVVISFRFRFPNPFSSFCLLFAVVMAESNPRCRYKPTNDKKGPNKNEPKNKNH